MFPIRVLLPAFALTAVSVALPLSLSAQTTPTPPPAPLSRQQLLNNLDPDMRDVILLYDGIKGTHLEQLTPQDARQQIAVQGAAKAIARIQGHEEAPKPVGKVVDGMTIPGEGGVQIPIRLYYPQGAGPFPVILYFHGGGFVVATIDTYDDSARELCVDASAIVVSVEYRKAPEAPFPAAYDAAVTSYKWVIHTIDAYNGIASKVAVAGESAGGNLATEVSLAARSQGLQMPTHELLIYPETTSDLTQTSDYLYQNSTLPLYTAELPYFDAQYVQNPADKNNPDVAPILANLKGLEPTTIIAADEDPLKSDGVAYAAALQKAGDDVDYHLYTGTTHEFFGLGPVVKKAREAEALGSGVLKASFK